MESPTEYASKPMTAQADAAAWKHLERRIAALVEERQSESAFLVDGGFITVDKTQDGNNGDVFAARSRLQIVLVPK